MWLWLWLWLWLLLIVRRRVLTRSHAFQDEGPKARESGYSRPQSWRVNQIYA